MASWEQIGLQALIASRDSGKAPNVLNVNTHPTESPHPSLESALQEQHCILMREAVAPKVLVAVPLGMLVGILA